MDGQTGAVEKPGEAWRLRGGLSAARSPLPAEEPQARGLLVRAYFFLPWFLTASMAAAAAFGSR